MDQENVNAIVDNLAAKIGVAVEKLEPIAETLVREVHTYGVAKCVICGFLALLSACLIVWGTKGILGTKFQCGEPARGQGGKFGASLVSVVIGLFLAIPSIVEFFDGLEQAIKPTWIAVKGIL